MDDCREIIIKETTLVCHSFSCCLIYSTTDFYHMFVERTMTTSPFCERIHGKRLYMWFREEPDSLLNIYMWFQENFTHAEQQSKLSGVFTAKIIQYLQIKLCTGVYGLLHRDCPDGSSTAFRRIGSCYAGGS